MKAQDIVNQIKNSKGQHLKIVWQRTVKTFKTFDGIISKRTAAFVRTGIDYANLSQIKAEFASGERETVESLPFGEWRKGAEKYIIDHKGVEYIRLYPAVFENLKAEVEWSMNGKPATFAEVEPFLLASEKPKASEEKPLCFTVKAESIVTIG